MGGVSSQQLPFLGLLDPGSIRRVRGTPLDVFLFVFPGLMRPGDGLHQRFNLETAIGREKAMPAINVQRKFLQLVVTVRVMRDI